MPGFNYLVVIFYLAMTIIGFSLYSNISIYFIFFSIMALAFGILSYFLSKVDVGSFFPVFYLALLCASYLTIRKSNIDKFELNKLITICFYAYLVLSLVSFFIFPEKYRHFSFDGVFISRAFHGIEGSPANIDVFATLFIIINIYCHGFKKLVSWFHILIFLCVAYFCSTETPLLIILSISSYIITQFFFGRSINRFFICMMYLSMFLVFYFSFINDYIYDLLLIITNGRNYIWNTQLLNVASDLSYLDFFFGDFSKAFVPIHWSKEGTNNPHNGYIFLLLRFGILISFVFYMYILFISKRASYFQMLLIIALLAASVSNSNVFYISNPIITFIWVFALTSKIREPSR